MRLALCLAVAALAAAAPAAQAGCVDDYLRGPRYVAPRQETVAVSGGVVTVDTNAAPGDAAEVAGFGVGVTTNEAARAAALVDCIK